MNHSIFSDYQWLFPDTPLENQKEAALDIPRGGHSGFQFLTETTANSDFKISFSWDQEEAEAFLSVEIFELLPVGVNENTSPSLMTTADYNSCKSYMTRQAPFFVYDALKPLECSISGSRLAVYLSVNATPQAIPKAYTGALRLSETSTKSSLTVPIYCQIYSACVPDFCR